MTTSGPHHSNKSGGSEAAAWFVSTQGPDVPCERQGAFADWLRRSPVHVEEFLQLTVLNSDLARLAQLKEIDVDQELSLLAADDNVIAIDVTGSEGSAHPSQTSGRRCVLATAACLFLLCGGLWATGAIRDFLGKQQYQTEIGELRSLTLADGSQVQLNALSNLTATVNKAVRDIQLHEGQAMFRVARDPVHPFRVHTPQATIEAKGTQFDVRIANGITVVSLVEGHVLVTHSFPPMTGGRSGIPAAVLLNPGEEIFISDYAGTQPTPRRADIEAAVAWTEHRLVFDDAPLSTVIAEFNRYSRQPFVIQDTALNDVRITASFDSGSAQTFAESLSSNGQLRITRQPSGAWLIEGK